VSTSGPLANPVRYAGREFDSETGLYYNRARYYDPKVGRFVSEDRAGGGVANRYSYAGNNPVNSRDPTGQWCTWEDGAPQAEAAPAVGRPSRA
jgi:RHS repeat-associated protein